MEYAYPFDSVVTEGTGGLPVFDRAVSSEVLRKVYTSLYTNGVIPYTDFGMCEVRTVSGMKVSVDVGVVIISGAIKYFDQVTELTLDAANASNPRRDTVVAEFNASQSVRDITLKVVKGTPASVPQLPTLTRTAEVYQIALANIYVGAGVTAITSNKISDARWDDTRGGVATQRVNPAPLEEMMERYETIANEYTTEQQTAFNTWFSNIQESLSGDVAAQLADRIQQVENAVNGINNGFLDRVYPVGAVYISFENTDPSELFGGTWTRIGERFLYAAPTDPQSPLSVWDEGGEETHTLTIDEMPNHAHSINMNTVGYGGGGSLSAYFGKEGSPSHGNWGNIVRDAGGGAAHNNMPPYIVVNMWRRAL